MTLLNLVFRSVIVGHACLSSISSMIFSSMSTVVDGNVSVDADGPGDGSGTISTGCSTGVGGCSGTVLLDFASSFVSSSSNSSSLLIYFKRNEGEKKRERDTIN